MYSAEDHNCDFRLDLENLGKASPSGRKRFPPNDRAEKKLMTGCQRLLETWGWETC